MPVTVETAVSGPYTPNGVTVAFPFTFKADVAGEVIVVDQDGTELSDALYSVEVNAGEGGTVTFTTAPLAADYDELLIVSSPAMTQAADFSNTGPSFNPASLTRAIDRTAIKDIFLKYYITTVEQEHGALIAAETAARIAADTDLQSQLDTIIGLAKGDPGGNIMAIGLFSGASALEIPVGTDVVQTSGYSLKGVGIAQYVSDAAVDAAYVTANPYTSFISSNARGFRLVPYQELSVHAVGARGDGVTDDTLAIQRASAIIQGWGAGKLTFEPREYLVGTQTLAGATGLDYSWRGPGLGLGAVVLEGCTGNVDIIGNGAKFIYPADYKFGSFDPVTGLATGTQTDMDYWAFALHGAIYLKDNTGHIHIEGFEIDGGARVGEIEVGGKWPDESGWQVPGSGIWAYGNASISVRNVYDHHMPTDGMLLGYTGYAEEDDATPTNLVNCRFEYNGRQGLSWVGGKGLTAIDCKFNHTGKNGVIGSAPGAGLDVEAESAVVRGGRFINCEFLNNGYGMVAASGDSADVSFHGCKFTGTTTYALSPNKPRYHFYDCEIVGTLVNPYAGSDDNPGDAARFTRCRFTNDASLVPGGTLYTGGDGLLIDVGGVGSFVRFLDCQFIHDDAGTALNTATLTATFTNCEFIVRDGEFQMIGTFQGNTRYVEDGGTIVGTPGETITGTNDAGPALDNWTFRTGGVTTEYGPTQGPMGNLPIDGALLLRSDMADPTPGPDTCVVARTAADGLVLSGDGATYDVVMMNSVGTRVFKILHSTNTLELAGHVDLLAGELRVAGTRVVGAQGTAITDPAGGATVDAEGRTAIVSILQTMRAHGLIDT